jgi:hypothetical protein
MSLSRFALSICVCLPVALVGVLAPGCLAQLPIVTNTTSTPIPGAGHDYLNGPTETVNPANGSLSIRVPVILPPGRGFTLPFSFAYDSNGVNYLGYSPGQGYGVDYWLTPSPTTLTNPWTEGGWSDTVPMVSKTLLAWTATLPPPGDAAPSANPLISSAPCSALIDFVFQDASGNATILALPITTIPRAQDCARPKRRTIPRASPQLSSCKAVRIPSQRAFHLLGPAARHHTS